MKNFWPRRSDVKGFSIESLARKYRESISSISSDLSRNELNKDKNLNFINHSEKQTLKSDVLVNNVHWANRDFSEYRYRNVA